MSTTDAQLREQLQAALVKAAVADWWDPGDRGTVIEIHVETAVDVALKVMRGNV